MKIYLKTYGCQSNIADSEQLANLLKEHLVTTEKEADTIIINTCGVKEKTQNRIINYLKSIKNKKVYVGGCLTSMIDLTKYTNNISGIFDTNTITKVPELINQVHGIRIESKEKEDRIHLSQLRQNKEIAIINISQGCLNKCTFCGTKAARGWLKSYSIEQIKEQVEKAVNEGCKRIFLSSQDNGCYGYDINTDLSKLLNEIIKIEGNYQIRVGMGNPQHIIKILPDLIESYKSNKIQKFLHIPLQSGSDKILKHMLRMHNKETFLNIINSFRKKIPNIHIATDIIVGYPIETEKDFQETMDLLEQIKPEVINISKFARRPGTYATEKLKPLTTQEIKRRSRELTKLKLKLRKELNESRSSR